jgi:HlyD family secretion protein
VYGTGETAVHALRGVDLEIVTELLSTDAVRVSAGNRVIISDWGGQLPLSGVDARVDPWGFTKYSALGVEEQRVNVTIKFSGPVAKRSGLGHGFRVEIQIVVWEQDKALTLPSGALFRHKDEWAVFSVEDGKAVRHEASVGHNNGTEAQVMNGINENVRVILYPGPGLSDGTRVTERKLN